MATSFAAARPGADVDADPDPELPAPDLLPGWTNTRHASFEYRSAQLERRLPTQFWIRCTAELPDDPMLHAAVLTYVSDISNGLVPLEGTEMRSGPSLDHAVWFHRPARMDEWTWQDLVPHTAAGGRGLYTGTMYSAAGHASRASRRRPSSGRNPALVCRGVVECAALVLGLWPLAPGRAG